MWCQDCKWACGFDVPLSSLERESAVLSFEAESEPGLVLDSRLESRFGRAERPEEIRLLEFAMLPELLKENSRGSLEEDSVEELVPLLDCTETVGRSTM